MPNIPSIQIEAITPNSNLKRCIILSLNDLLRLRLLLLLLTLFPRKFLSEESYNSLRESYEKVEENY